MNEHREPIIFDNPDAWLEFRRTGIGASEVPAALGYNRYKSPYTLWAEKTGRISSDVDTLPARIGHALEPFVAAEYEREHAGRLIDPGDFAVFKHSDLDFLFATPDRLLANKDGDVFGAIEMKTVDSFNADEERHGTTKDEHTVQLQAQMDCLGLDYGELAILIGNRELKTFRFKKNPDFLKLAHEKLFDFWECVKKDTPPEIDGTASTSDTLKTLHPDDNGTVIALSGNAVLAITEIRRLQDLANRMLQSVDRYKNELRDELAAATFGVADEAGLGVSLKTITREGSLSVPLQYLDKLDAAKIPYKRTDTSTYRRLHISTSAAIRKHMATYTK